jgi:hypothetical protein
MFLLRTGMKPEVSRGVFVRPLAITLSALALAGCRGHTEAYNSSPGWGASTPRSAAIAAYKVEVEDDGLPSQLPPPVRSQQLPDDPNEPWSKNYGDVAGRSDNDVSAEESFSAEDEAPAAPVAVIPRAKQADIPSDLPPDFQKKLKSAMAAD